MFWHSSRGDGGPAGTLLNQPEVSRRNGSLTEFGCSLAVRRGVAWRGAARMPAGKGKNRIFEGGCGGPACTARDSEKKMKRKQRKKGKRCEIKDRPAGKKLPAYDRARPASIPPVFVYLLWRGDVFARTCTARRNGASSVSIQPSRDAI